MVVAEVTYEKCGYQSKSSWPPPFSIYRKPINVIAVAMNLAENRIGFYRNTNLTLPLVIGSLTSDLILFEDWPLYVALIRSAPFNGVIVRCECPT